MKIQVEYDPATGQMSDPTNGALLTSWTGLSHLEVKEQEAKESNVADLAKLKSAGFTAEEIMQMKREGLV